jgi:hypothetical protein
VKILDVKFVEWYPPATTELAVVYPWADSFLLRQPLSALFLNYYVIREGPERRLSGVCQAGRQTEDPSSPVRTRDESGGLSTLEKW